jgi:surfactin synthase thioesterase subunit
MHYWQEVTTQPLEQLEVEGGHMYLVEQPAPLFALLRAFAADDVFERTSMCS